MDASKQILCRPDRGRYIWQILFVEWNVKQYFSEDVAVTKKTVKSLVFFYSRVLVLLRMYEQTFISFE